VKDPTSQLRSATRRAKSDVANKLISMFLHELSRKLCQNWQLRVDGDEYGDVVRQWFDNKCPYYLRNLFDTESIIEHLDGMNRCRAGLHVPGNVLVACRRCNGEKRRDDAQRILLLAESGWASFLSHDGTRCAPRCFTCRYWRSVWDDETERTRQLAENLLRIRSFRRTFSEFERVLPALQETLPSLLAKLYSDGQSFAELEIRSLLERFEQVSARQIEEIVERVDDLQILKQRRSPAFQGNIENRA
jgi:hypothetical protein